MADENPATNTPQDDDSTKKETIRITLPPKGDAPGVKRETVRINVPGTQSQPLSSIPKKETSKITLPQSAVTPPPALPAGGPPTKPLSSAPPPPVGQATKPLSSATPPPKPPPLSGRPTVPLRPSAPSSGAVPPSTAPSGIARPASPKKETARISLPSEAPKSSAPALPKATVKMQQTQPMLKGPASGTRSQPLASTAQSVASTATSSSRKSDTISIVLSVFAFLTASTALWFTYTDWKESDEPSWVGKMKNEQPPVPAVFTRKLD